MFGCRFGFAKRRINDIFEKFKIFLKEMDEFVGMFKIYFLLYILPYFLIKASLLKALLKID